MEQIISKWLKDDLGLANMCEADVYGLLYHPRHGTLCRRFLKFLIDSTICANKHPNVLVKEELDNAKAELRANKNEAVKLDGQIERCLEENEDLDSELVYLHKRLESLKQIKHKRKSSLEFLGKITRQRQNLAFEQTDFLNKNPLASLYAVPKPTPFSSDQQLATMDQAVKDRTNETNAMHQAIGSLLYAINEKICNLEPGIKPSGSLTLQMPVEKEKIIEPEEEKAAVETNKRLTKEVKDLKQEVAELAENYKLRRQQIDESNRRKIEPFVRFRRKILDLEIQLKNSRS